MANILLPFVTTYDDKGAKKAQTSLAGLSKNFLSAGVVVGGVATFMKSAITSASNLQETINKTNVVFGAASGSIREFANTASTKLGQSKQQALDAASTFAAFGKSAGLAGEDLVGFSTDFVTLAADLASFNNTTPQEAIEAIGAALRGEAEPIRKYNVLLSDAVLKNRALEMKIYSGSGALTAQQKILATQAEILDQASDAVGDYERTSDGFANTTKSLTAQFQDLSAEIGGKFLPVAEDLALITSTVATETKDADSGTKIYADTVFSLSKRFVPLFGIVERVRDSVGSLADTIRDASAASIDSAADFRKFDQMMSSKYEKSLKQATNATSDLGKSTEKADKKAEKYANTLRERVKTALDATNDALEKAQAEYDDYSMSLSNAITGTISLADAYKTQTDADRESSDALRERTEAYQELSRIDPTEDADAYADALNRVAKAEENVRVAADKRKQASVEQVFTDQIANAREFAQNLQYLVQHHNLGQAALSQLINLGVDAGNEVTRAMIMGTSGLTAGGLNESLASISSAASSFGTAGANQFFGGALGTATANQGQVNQYSITVNAGLVSNPAQVGRDIIEAIKNAERVSGQVFVSV